MARRKGPAKRKRDDIVDLTSDKENYVDEPVKARKTAKNATARSNETIVDVADEAHPGSASSRPGPSVRISHDADERPNRSITGPTTQQNYATERESWLADDADFNEVVSSSQTDADGSDALQHYGDLSTKIVGVQYYNGYANEREQIIMRREPGNPYDRNAIRVDNVAGVQIGHVPRTVAAKLAKYFDNAWLHLEGQLAGAKGHFDCPLAIHMYGPTAESPEGRNIREMMEADKLPLQGLKEAERRRKQKEKAKLSAARKLAAAQAKGKFVNQASSVGFDRPGQPDLADILEASQSFNPRQAGEAADAHGVSEEQLESMPKADTPAEIKTTMLPYQLQALQWLLDMETPQLPESIGESVQLWQKSNTGGYTNLATTTTQEDPKLASGGILADDMGLGKTLQMIALIVADAAKAGKGTTLIVAPLSVMSNWSDQIAMHVKPSHKLDVYTYHGSNRAKMNADEFAKYDVVVTTYQTLATEFMPAKSSKTPERKLRAHGLYSMDWRRVILDEGHQVRNANSKGAAAVNALFARSRWVLTGTPIVNSLKDLYSLLRFVGVTGGLEQLDIYNRVLVRPLREGDESAASLLQAIMASFTLRRRKDMAFVDLKLPKLDEYVHRIDFSAKEKERYEALNAEAQGLLRKYERSQEGQGENNGTYQHLLEILLRMRQCCNHWQLCGERVTKLLAKLGDRKTVERTPENDKALQDLLQVQIESQEDCAICLDTLHNPVITTCGHFFGYDCIAKVIETQHKCPMCRAELKDEQVLVHPAYECGDEHAADDLDLKQSSTKLEALAKILTATAASGKGKTVVFSQWTSFLDIVQTRLQAEGFKLCRLDGTMSATKRDEALRALSDDEETTVMLASLGVCAVGLNLTAANHVVLADSWWAPAIEDQAVDRVHRLGQKRETKVFRLVMGGSIEERTLEVQADKRKLMQLAFSERASKREGARAGRLADLQRLLT